MDIWALIIASVAFASSLLVYVTACGGLDFDIRALKENVNQRLEVIGSHQGALCSRLDRVEDMASRPHREALIQKYEKFGGTAGYYIVGNGDNLIHELCQKGRGYMPVQFEEEVLRPRIHEWAEAMKVIQKVTTSQVSMRKRGGSSHGRKKK